MLHVLEPCWPQPQQHRNAAAPSTEALLASMACLQATAEGLTKTSHCLAMELLLVKPPECKSKGSGSSPLASGSSEASMSAMTSSTSAQAEPIAVPAAAACKLLPPYVLQLLTQPTVTWNALDLTWQLQLQQQQQSGSDAPSNPLLPPLLMAAAATAGQAWEPWRPQLPLSDGGSQRMEPQQQSGADTGASNSGSAGMDTSPTPFLPLDPGQMDVMRGVASRVQSALRQGCHLLCLLPSAPAVLQQLCGVVFTTPVGGAGSALWVHEELTQFRCFRTCQTAYEAAEVGGRGVWPCPALQGSL